MDIPAIKYTMPPDPASRNKISGTLTKWLETTNSSSLPIPPVEFETLFNLATEFSSNNNISNDYIAFIMVLISNHIWMPWLQGVPYDKRLLLLPNCLASSDKCQGYNDQFGLVCNKCGHCDIAEIERKAKELGYVVLIAEGSPVVAELIKTGQIKGIVGVSCFEALDKVFKHINNAAVPAIAIPLNQDGCKDTEVDTKWLLDLIATPFDNTNTLSDFNQIKDEVYTWFSKENIASLFEKLNINISETTSKVSIDWITRDGKRHRPVMTAAVYDTLSKSGNSVFPASIIHTSVAIELFHKASLVHDDIEDNDDERYGLPTINNQFGDAFAINIGDFIIGTGYRLIAEQNSKPEIVNRLLVEVAKAHQQLSSGQGAELALAKKEIDLDTIFNIYKDKTSPAFRVALLSGAIIAEACQATLETLTSLSDYLGIAYQIKDDLEDTDDDKNELSILNAIDNNGNRISLAKAELLLSEFRTKARIAISNCSNPELKFLLTRLITKITE